MMHNKNENCDVVSLIHQWVGDTISWPTQITSKNKHKIKIQFEFKFNDLWCQSKAFRNIVLGEKTTHIAPAINIHSNIIAWSASHAHWKKKSNTLFYSVRCVSVVVVFSLCRCLGSYKILSLCESFKQFVGEVGYFSMFLTILKISQRRQKGPSIGICWGGFWNHHAI